MATIIFRDPSRLTLPPGPRIVTIGNFDGVHLGHQEVLKRMTAQKGFSVVISLHPHPSVVLGRVPSLPRITTVRQKQRVFSVLGVNALYMMRFTRKLAATPAAEFIDRVVLGLLGATYVVLGPDTALGKDREGDGKFILAHLQKRGVSGEALSFLEVGGDRISSRRIRDLVAQGQVAEAQKLLGRPFELDAYVIHGDGRGKQIGFPTANLSFSGQIIPVKGVYRSNLVVDGKSYRSLTNVGERPTFGGRGLAVECHVPGENLALYGKRVGLQFLDRIRDEKKFSSVEELKRQIAEDIRKAGKGSGNGLENGLQPVKK